MLETAIKTVVQPTLSDQDKAFITRLAKRIQQSGFVTPGNIISGNEQTFSIAGKPCHGIFWPNYKFIY